MPVTETAPLTCLSTDAQGLSYRMKQVEHNPEADVIVPVFPASLPGLRSGSKYSERRCCRSLERDAFNR